jgi:hypothetical protein
MAGLRLARAEGEPSVAQSGAQGFHHVDDVEAPALDMVALGSTLNMPSKSSGFVLHEFYLLDIFLWPHFTFTC